MGASRDVSQVPFLLGLAQVGIQLQELSVSPYAETDLSFLEKPAMTLTINPILAATPLALAPYPTSHVTPPSPQSVPQYAATADYTPEKHVTTEEMTI